MPNTLFSPSSIRPSVLAVEWREDRVVLLDQTRLPSIEIYVDCCDSETLIDAIQRLVVRGAPAIGITGAYGSALALSEVLRESLSLRKDFLLKKLHALENARPTAVNLRWAVSKMRDLILSDPEGITQSTLQRVLVEAKLLHDEDILCNQKIASYGAKELKHGAVITVCNTGDLATGGVGTAFGILHEGFVQGKISRVYACETRPVLQGMRLTAWELERNKIPFTMICDNMAAVVMQKEKIAGILVGADRIAANGDSANKIGTYSLAVLAKAHGIPFYVAAPYSTFDLSIESGEQIPIEERSGEEIISILGPNRHQFEVPVFNPAFDVTPHSLITAIVCDRGVIHAPNQAKVREFLHQPKREKNKHS